MDEHDKQNLKFILNAGQEEFANWYNSIDDDDRDYAAELLYRYGLELDIKSALLTDKKIRSLKEANAILKKFML